MDPKPKRRPFSKLVWGLVATAVFAGVVLPVFGYYWLRGCLYWLGSCKVELLEKVRGIRVQSERALDG